MNRQKQDYKLVVVGLALVICHVSCWQSPDRKICWNKNLDAIFEKARTNAQACVAAAGIVLASNVVNAPIASAEDTRLEMPAATQSTVFPDEDSANVGSATHGVQTDEKPIESQSQISSIDSLENEEVKAQPTIRSTETTQIQVQVETKALVSSLESNRGDLNDAIARLARQVPFDSIQINPPLANPRLVKPKPEPLVDVDQLVANAWQSFVNSLPTATSKDDNSVPLFIPIPNKPTTDWWDQTYTVTVPSYNVAIQQQQLQQQQQRESSTTTTSFTYSNGQATQVTTAAAALSYPISYAYYQYELDQAEKKAQAKKAAMKAKKAAAAAASKKKKSGKDKEAKAAQTKKGPKGADNELYATKKGLKGAERQPFETKSPIGLVSSKVLSAKDATFEKTQAESIQKQTTPTEEAPEIASSAVTSTPEVDTAQQPTIPSSKVHLPQQDGGMDAYEKAYAAMLAASTSSPPTATQPSTRTENQPPLVEVNNLPEKAETVTMFVEQRAPDQVIATSLPLQGTTSLETGRSQIQSTDNGGMSAYEKAYAAMVKSKVE